MTSATSGSLGASLLFIALSVAATSCSPDLRAPPPLPEGRRLREIVSERYDAGSVLVGAALGSQSFGTSPAIILDREFSYVTPENDFKHMTIREDPGAWRWDAADAWVNHVVENGQTLRMHSPIGPQCSTWAKDDARTGLELDSELKQFLQQLCRRYKGKPGFRYLDVVNETVVEGRWHTDKPGSDSWECPWFKIGQDSDESGTPLFIGSAFEAAAECLPDMRLIFNHHEGPEEAASWELIKKTVTSLRARGLRVDGIGWQAHVDSGWETPEHLEVLQRLITWAHVNGLEFHVTEASVWLKHGGSQRELQAQASTYAAILRVMLENRASGVVAWNTWHVSDAVGWHTAWLPSLFDERFRAKPAYSAIQAELEKH